MFKVEDLNPLLIPPTSLIRSKSVGSGANNPSTSITQSGTNVPFDERPLTDTNYYRFATVSKINCYFYQVVEAPPQQKQPLQENTTDSRATPDKSTPTQQDEKHTPLQMIHTYDNIIKDRLSKDYCIKDIITYVAKKEICIFQMEIKEDDIDSDIGFNQLKDAIDNIINENKIYLKLVSSSKFDSSSILKQTPSPPPSQGNPQQQVRPINIIYLSFLRAFKRYISLKLTNIHNLSTINKSISRIQILPFGNHLIVSPLLEKQTEDNSPSSTTSSLPTSILEPYSILKLSPSLGYYNDLMANLSTSKALKLYKLSDFVNSKDATSFMERKDYVIYLCPSGVRCFCAIKNSLTDSITDEAPINYEKLIKLLDDYTTINLQLNASTNNKGGTKWIKLVPNINHMNGLTPKISKFLDSFIPNTKYIMWPLDLCFIQFASDVPLPIISNSKIKCETTAENNLEESIQFETEDPLGLIEDFIEVCGDLEREKAQQEAEEAEEKQRLQQLNKENSMINDDNEGNDTAPVVATNLMSDWIADNSMIDNSVVLNDEELNDAAKGSIDQMKMALDEQNITPVGDDILSSNFNDPETDVPSSKGEDGNEDDNEDWDELFGDDDDNEGENDSVDDNHNNNKEVSTSVPNSTTSLDESEIISKYDTNVDAINPLDPFKQESKELPQLSTTAEQLTVQPSNDLELQPATNPLYEDPGAPSPATFHIFASPSPSDQFQQAQQIKDPQQQKEDMPSSSSNNSKDENKIMTPKDKKISIFAPLNFNPLIEKDIDSKYSNGGKFFVKDGSGSQSPSVTNAYSNTVMEGTMTTPTFWRTGVGLGSVLNSATKRKFGEYELEFTEQKEDDLISDSDEEDEEDDEEGEDDEDDDEDIGDEDNDKYNEIKENNPNDDDEERSRTGSDENNEYDISGFGLGISINQPQNSNTELLSSNPVVTMTPTISSSVLVGQPSSSLTPALPTSATLNSNEIQNWVYWILRGPSTSTIPTFFLSNSNPKITNLDLNGLLPILQELVLFSPLDTYSKDLNIMSQGRELPMMLPCDVESVIDNIFPGVSKVKLYELLESNKSFELNKPFECLFGGGGGNSASNNNEDRKSNKYQLQLPLSSGPSYRDQFLFDDPSFATTSPLLTINSNPPAEVEFKRSSKDMNNGGGSSNANGGQSATNRNIMDNISRNSLFRAPTTIINAKRLDQDLKINQTSLGYWKILNLQPLKGEKNFKVLFIIPKMFEFFKERSKSFLNSVADSYKSCKLGSISSLFKDGDQDSLLEIEATTEYEFWDDVENKLNGMIKKIQDDYLVEQEDNKVSKPILLLFGTPFTNLKTIIRISKLISKFNSLLTEKIVEKADAVVEDDKKQTKKRKKSVVQTKISLPIELFFKIIPIEFYFNQNGNFSIYSNQQLIDLSLKLYNLCPSTKTGANPSTTGYNKLIKNKFKDRDPFFTVAKDLPKKIYFMLTKSPIAKNLINDELFLHVCYERSIDKNWCVACWTNQYGSINYTKSWYTNSESKNSKTFEDVSNEIMEITLDYTNSHIGKSYVILTRLNNMIPDDELTEWKRLSVRNNRLTLIVLTVELEPSTLILSSALNNDKINNLNNASNMNKKDDLKEFYSVRYSIGSANSQIMTPNFMNNNNSSTNQNNNIGHSSNNPNNIANNINRINESPELFTQTPSYDLITSPMDSQTYINSPTSPNPLNAENQILIDLADEYYGVILQMSQPLSNQSIRLPLKTGFLINSGMGSIGSSNNGNINCLEINLLSCQSGINSIELLKNLIIQFKNLSLFSKYYDLNPCQLGNNNNYNSVNVGQVGEVGKAGPWHILSVRKMLDCLVHIKVE